MLGIFECARTLIEKSLIAAERLAAGHGMRKAIRADLASRDDVGRLLVAETLAEMGRLYVLFSMEAGHSQIWHPSAITHPMRSGKGRMLGPSRCAPKRARRSEARIRLFESDGNEVEVRTRAHNLSPTGSAWANAH